MQTPTHTPEPAIAQTVPSIDAPQANPIPTQPQAVSELSQHEREAMEYVRDIKSFYTHAIQYGLVMVVLLVINLITNPGYLWVVWPALGWGIGVAIHGLNVFEIVNVLGDKWERKQIQKRMKHKV